MRGIRGLGKVAGVVGLMPMVVLTPAAIAQQGNPPEFVDERRLPQAVPEAELKQRQAEDDRRRAAEAEAKRQAEIAAQKQAAEAEARRKEEMEARRAAAEAEAKRKAAAEEEARRQQAAAAAEAEAKRKAAAEEEARRQQAAAAAEAEAKRKAAAEDQARRQQAAAVAPGAIAAGAEAGPCADEKLAAQPRAGGILDVTLTSPCRAGRTVTLRYGTFSRQYQLDGTGTVVIPVDAFLGKTTPAQLVLADGKRVGVPLELVDLTGVSKVAVIWKSGVDIDLHAYEYTAQHGGAGHVWSKAPSSAEAAAAELAKGPRGRGFMSTVDDGRSAGDKLEVYTFVHHSQQVTGLISTALDYASRGDAPAGATCGSGRDASIGFETVLLTARGAIEREFGAIAGAPCGVRLTGTSRYLGDAVPDLSATP